MAVIEMVGRSLYYGINGPMHVSVHGSIDLAARTSEDKYRLPSVSGTGPDSASCAESSVRDKIKPKKLDQSIRRKSILEGSCP